MLPATTTFDVCDLAGHNPLSGHRAAGFEFAVWAFLAVADVQAWAAGVGAAAFVRQSRRCEAVGRRLG
jgi:hypothetical protein